MMINTVNDSIVGLHRHLNDFMNRLADHIYAKDTLFKCHVILLGSSKEKTKILPVCEFDFNFVCENFITLCEPSSSPACPAGFAYLKGKSNQFSPSSAKQYFDLCSNNLITKDFKKKFYFHLTTILQQPKFWKDEQCFELPTYVE